MREALARALVLAVGALVLVSLVVFAFVQLPPGDPALALLGTPPWLEEARAINRALADRPVHIRYVLWTWRMVKHLVRRPRARDGLSPALPEGPA